MPSFSQERRTYESWERFPGLERVAPGGRVALTFDDGPDPEGTAWSRTGSSAERSKGCLP